MKLINGSRGSGKTHALIKYAHENNCLILTHSHVSARIIKNRAIELKLNILEPMTFEEYFDDELFKRKGLVFNRGQFPIVVDELDSCLSNFLGEKIECATGTIKTIHPTDYLISEHLKRGMLSEDSYYDTLDIWK